MCHFRIFGKPCIVFRPPSDTFRPKEDPEGICGKETFLTRFPTNRQLQRNKYYVGWELRTRQHVLATAEGVYSYIRRHFSR